MFQISQNSRNIGKNEEKIEKIRFFELTFYRKLMIWKRNSFSKNRKFPENQRSKLVKNRKIPKTSRKNKQNIRKHQFSKWTFNRKVNHKINNFSKSLFWHSWIPRANFRQKIETLNFLSKCPYLTRTNTWMFCPRSVLIGFLGVADIFAPDFLLFCRQFFERNFQIPILKQKCVDLNCWELNLTAIGCFLGCAIQNRITHQKSPSVYGNGLAGVFLFSGTFVIETRNLP